MWSASFAKTLFKWLNYTLTFLLKPVWPTVDKLQAELMMALYTEMKAVLQDLPFEAYAVHKVVCRNDPSRQKNSTAEVLAALERELPGAQVSLGAMPQVGGAGICWV